MAVIGLLLLTEGMIPVDILPAFKSPVVQELTFSGSMTASSIEKDITNRMERGVRLNGYHAPIGFHAMVEASGPRLATLHRSIGPLLTIIWSQ
jgi:hypothetical protein